MKFCPVCETKLKKGDSGLKCAKCGHTEGGGDRPPRQVEEDFEPELDVMSESDSGETMPTVEMECQKCGNKEAVWWMLQTRSADEPTTQFYRCTKCKFTWRDYA